MTLRDQIHTSWSNLGRRKMRFFLASLGVLVGTVTIADDSLLEIVAGSVTIRYHGIGLAYGQNTVIGGTVTGYDLTDSMRGGLQFEITDLHLSAASSPRRAPVVVASQRKMPISRSTSKARLSRRATCSASGGLARRRPSFGGGESPCASLTSCRRMPAARGWIRRGANSAAWMSRRTERS